MHKNILLIYSDNRNVVYEELAEYQRRYPYDYFWVNQCSYDDDYSPELESKLMDTISNTIDQVFILNGGIPLSSFDDLVLCVIQMARLCNKKLVYYTDSEVSIGV